MQRTAEEIVNNISDIVNMTEVTFLRAVHLQADQVHADKEQMEINFDTSSNLLETLQRNINRNFVLQTILLLFALPSLVKVYRYSLSFLKYLGNCFTVALSALSSSIQNNCSSHNYDSYENHTSVTMEPMTDHQLISTDHDESRPLGENMKAASYLSLPPSDEADTPATAPDHQTDREGRPSGHDAGSDTKPDEENALLHP